LARRMDADVRLVGQMLTGCKIAGLVSENQRLTKAGHDVVKAQSRARRPARKIDRSLYVPTSWCTGRATVQPPVLDDRGSREQADSAEPSSADGDGG
jgi:hypothetical protein